MLEAPVSIELTNNNQNEKGRAVKARLIFFAVYLPETGKKKTGTAEVRFRYCYYFVRIVTEGRRAVYFFTLL